MARLPETFFARLTILVTGCLRSDRDAEPWLGHHVFLLDGTGIPMPDTPELQKAFGQPVGQRLGCGFPVAHLLALFDHRTGYLVETHFAPLATHDLAHASTRHPALGEGDILWGDRAFGSFAHLALLCGSQRHGMFRQHQRRPRGVANDRRSL